MAVDKITIGLVRERETKGTFRYKEVADKVHPPVIGTLYIKKTAMERLGGVPKEIIVTIEST